MKKFCCRITIILCCLFCYFYLSAEEKLPLVYKIDLKKEIGSTTWRYVQCGMNEARQLGASAVLVHMNTYGGTVVHADSIRTM
ncbi:MAG: nodulation protein NfeD, partial [Barnesiella sp.]